VAAPAGRTAPGRRGEELPLEHHVLFGLWPALGVPAFVFVFVLAILWLMIAKPPGPLID
jgi:uncharacterized membrane protein